MNKSKWMKKTGRKIYKQTGYVNPVKKGRVSSSRVLRQLPKLAADVLSLKSMVNAEKKRLEVPQTTAQAVGQISTNSSGHFLLDFTPVIAQGTGYNQRTGNSVKWHSSFLDLQFIQQVNQISRMRFKIQLVKVVGLPYSTMSNVMGKFIEPTAFVTGGTIYDYNSPRNPDYFRDFVVLRTVYATMKADSTTGDSAIVRKKIGIKFKDHHIKTDLNTSTLTQGQVFLLITCDQGNCGGSVSTLTNVAQTAASTGALLNYEFTHYYYDN